MSEIDIRVTGRAGRITLNRPAALNALTYDMCLAIDAALDEWRDDDAVALVVIDATGDKAFCAGGDLSRMYRTGTAGDYGFGRKFWRDEYRLNAKIAAFPKPYIAFMQGFTMGGGVGISCHGSHRVVGSTSRIAMPECGVGLIPDVGGSHLLAHAPGNLGEYLGTTGHRMDAGDAIYAGFADLYVPEDAWNGVTADLERTGTTAVLDQVAKAVPDSKIRAHQAAIDQIFSAATVATSRELLSHLGGDWASDALKKLQFQSPLSVECTFRTIRTARAGGTLDAALAAEYRFTHRCMEHGDFLEGIRAAIIDKDRNPNWRHSDFGNVSSEEIAAMTAPLGDDELDLKGAGI